MGIRFIVYGMLGWVVEILWTGMGSVLRADRRLQATTYLWMFPIYGGGGLLLEGMFPLFAGRGWLGRGLAAVAVIYGVEYATGWVIRRLVGRAPWDYSGRPLAVHGLIRLDYAPAWFVLALLFERALPLLNAVAAAAASMVK